MIDLILIIVGQGDIFHGPVILADISNTISLTCILLGVMVHSDTGNHFISFLGHYDLYFTVKGGLVG